MTTKTATTTTTITKTNTVMTTTTTTTTTQSKTSYRIQTGPEKGVHKKEFFCTPFFGAKNIWKNWPLKLYILLWPWMLENRNIHKPTTTTTTTATKTTTTTTTKKTKTMTTTTTTTTQENKQKNDHTQTGPEKGVHKKQHVFRTLFFEGKQLMMEELAASQQHTTNPCLGSILPNKLGH
jgi:hypothetical protein